jgi:hypothetical protein
MGRAELWRTEGDAQHKSKAGATRRRQEACFRSAGALAGSPRERAARFHHWHGFWRFLATQLMADPARPRRGESPSTSGTPPRRSARPARLGDAITMSTCDLSAIYARVARPGEARFDVEPMSFRRPRRTVGRARARLDCGASQGRIFLSICLSIYHGSINDKSMGYGTHNGRTLQFSKVFRGFSPCIFGGGTHFEQSFKRAAGIGAKPTSQGLSGCTARAGVIKSSAPGARIRVARKNQSRTQKKMYSR